MWRGSSEKDGTGLSRTARAQLLARTAAAPLVLLVVLAVHVSMRSSADLTPWKGGGFGMFSTIDSPGTRVLRVELETDVGTVPVAVPSGLRDLAGAAKTAPSAERLLRLADELASQWWAVPDLAGPNVSVPGGDEALRDLAVEALSQVVPVEAVQAIDPARFDEAQHRRLEIRRVVVAVLRLQADDAGEAGEAGELRPSPIRAVAFDVAAQGGTQDRDGER